MLSIKERLLAEQNVKKEQRIVSKEIEGFGTVHIKVLTFSERAKIETDINKLKKSMGNKSGDLTETEVATRGALIILGTCLCDENRVPLLSAEELEAMNGIDFGSEWATVVEVCMEINHMSPKQVEAVKKK